MPYIHSGFNPQFHKIRPVDRIVEKLPETLLLLIPFLLKELSDKQGPRSPQQVSSELLEECGEEVIIS